MYYICINTYDSYMIYKCDECCVCQSKLTVMSEQVKPIGKVGIKETIGINKK